MITEYDINVGFKWKTNNTPRDCYNVVTKIEADGIGPCWCTYDTVWPCGMRPSTAGPLNNLVNYLNRPHIGLEII